MAENVEGNIRFNADVSDAISKIQKLQRELAVFHKSVAAAGDSSEGAFVKLRQGLLKSINAEKDFSASMTRVKSSAEAFTHALEKNKMSMGEYYNYARAASQKFSKVFAKGIQSEISQIQEVAESRVKTLQTRFISMGRDANGALQAIKVRPLTLDMKNLTTQQMIAVQKQQLFNQLLRQGSTQLLNWGKNTQWAGRQLMVGFTIPMTMFASAAAKAYMEIEKQSIAFKRVYGDFSTTTKETNAMADSMKNLASEFTKYGVAVSDTMDLAAKAAAMGKTGQALKDQVRETTRLSVLGAVDQQQALETTISLTNAFGTAAEDLAGKVDFLNAVENQTVTSISDLTEAIPKAGPVIKQLGGNVEDLTFFLTAMREGGINASEGANALKSGLASIINPTGKAVQMLSSFGINIQDIVQKDKGNVKQLVIDLASALDKLDPTQRAQAIEQMFGKFQFSRISTLFQNVIKDGSQAQKVLELTNASSAELATLSKRELSKISESPMYKFQKSIEDFRAALAPVGEEFMKAITPLINMGTGILKMFNSLDDGWKNIIVIGTGIAGVIGPAAIMIAGLFANAIGSIGKFVASARMLLGGNKDLALSTSYLTQEQLEGAAAASDLDAKHSKLRATFTAEASAVNALSQAYRTAKADIRALNLESIDNKNLVYKPSTRKTRVTKAATGGFISGPGTGTSDSIPAMLSNGEAVIPAKKASKYRGLISGMISGKLPGFADGTPNVRRGRYDRNHEEGIFQYMKSKLRGSSVFGKAGSELSYGSFSKEDEIVRKALEKQLRAENPKMSQAEFEKKVRSMLGTDMAHKKKSTRVERVGGRDIEVKNWESKNLQKEHRSINQYLQNLSDRGSGSYLANFKPADIAKAAGVSPQVAAKELKALQTGSHPSSRSGYQVLKAISDKDTGPRGKAVSELLKFRLNDKSPGSYLSALEAGSLNLKSDPALDAKARQEQQRRIAIAEQDLAKLKEQEVKDQKEITKTTKKTKEQVVTTQKQQQSKVSSREVAVQSGGQYYAMDETGKKRRISNEQGAQMIAAQQKRDQQNERRRQLRAEQKAARIAAEANIVKPTMGQRVAAGAKNIGSKIVGGAKALGPMGGMMAVGAVGAGISAIPGLEGFGAAVSTIGPLLMMLPGPIAAVVGGLGAMVGIVMSVNAAMEKQREANVKLADAQVMNQSTLEKMSADLGTVSATEARKAAQTEKLTHITKEQLNASEQYLKQTESGKSLLADVNLMKSSGKTSIEIGDTTARNLANAVAQNVITKEQGIEIIKALGQMSGDMAIAAQATSGFNTYTRDLTKTSGMTSSSAISSAKADWKSSLNPLYTVGSSSELGNDSKFKDENAAKVAALKMVNAYGQTVGGIDAINAQYETKKKEAKTDKEIADLEAQRIAAVAKQEKLAQSALEGIKTYKSEIGSVKFDDQFLSQIKENFGEDSPMYKTADKIRWLKDDTQAGMTFKTTLETQLASGTLSPESVDVLMKYADKNPKFKANYNASITANGEIDTLNLISSMQAAGATDKSITVALDLVSGPNATHTVEEITAASNELAAINDMGEVQVKVTSNTLKDFADDVEKIKGLAGEGDITFDVVSDYIGDKDIAKAITDNEYFQSLPKEQKISYLAKYTAVLDAIEKDSSVFDAWKKNNPNGTKADYIAEIMRNSGQSSSTANTKAPVEATKSTGGGGGGSTEDKKLADLNKKLDKQQKALNVIALKEDAINKKYDERKKKLEEIAKLNDRNARSQKDQLSVAQAIASGDIAAAANAIQEARANSAQQASQDQIDALDKARQNELDAITFNGQTRLELEQKIADLQLKIAEREYELSGTQTSGGGGGGGGGWIKPKKPTGNTPGYEWRYNEKVTPPRWEEVFVGANKNSTGTITGTTGASLDTTNKETFKYKDYAAVHGTGGAVTGYADGKGGTISTAEYEKAKKLFQDGADAARDAFNQIGSGATLTRENLESLSPSFMTTIDGIKDQMAANGELSLSQDELASRLQEMGYKVENGKVKIKTAAGEVQVPLEDVAGAFDDLERSAKDAAKRMGRISAAQEDYAKGRISTSALINRIDNAATGGLISSVPGLVYRALGGAIPGFKPVGTDTIPAMLTPGEFVVSRPAVDKIGVDNLRSINKGQLPSGSVYNYSVTVNANGNASADDIARTVITKLKQVESQRLRGNSY